MLIGRLERRRFDLKIGYRAFFSPRCRSLTFIYEGLLGNGSPENSKLMLEEIMRSLRQGEADLVFFNSLKVDSPIYCFATSLPGFLSRDNFPDRREHWTMKLPRSVEEFYLGLSPKARRNRRQEANKLLRDHSNNVRVRCLRETGEVDQMIQDIEEVAKRTYHRGLGVGFHDSAEMRRRLHLEAQQGRLRAYILYVAEKPCAFWLATLYGRTLHGHFTGYDPDFAKYSPGTFILLRIIEDSCGSNVEEIDFGFGDAWYKEFFCNCKWYEASSYIFAPTLKGLGLNLLRTPTMAVDKAARMVAERTKLLPKVKKAWRGLLRDRTNSSFPKSTETIARPPGRS
ncbi:MAG TPA: GNAT family N-acetyltransferase [Terriglobia bacterium]|nr:GNAT family N-acetyltransferase [Terriglobia bacterium]